MSLKHNVIANFIGQGWTALMGLAFIPLYIKYLGVEAYGLIGFYAVMQAWLTLFDMGITQTLNREMARFRAGAHTSQSIHNLLRSLEIISGVLALVICFLVLLASHYIANHWLKARILNADEIAVAVSLMGVVISMRFIEGIYKGALMGLQKQVAVNVVNVIIATMRYGGVVVVLAFYKLSIEAFFVWQVFSSLLSVLLLIFLVYKTLPKASIRPQFSKYVILDIARFASGMMGITFLALLLTQIDKVLLSKLITLEEYGYYTLAAAVAGGLALITVPITQAIYPKLVEYISQEKQDELVRIYHQGSQLVSLLLAPISMMLIFFAHDIIFLWSGDALLADKVSPILIPLVIGSFLNCLVWMPYQLQLAYGWTGFAIKVNTVAVILLVPAIFLVAPRYGAVGAAWIWALLNFGYVTVGMHFMYKKLLQNEKWAWYWNDISKQFFISFCLMLFIRMLAADFSHNIISEVGVFTFSFIMTFLIVLSQSRDLKPLAKITINKFLTRFRTI